MDKKYWVASIATLGVVDLYAAYVRKQGTLSQAAREIFRTDTTRGKILWVGGWACLTGWLVPHVWKWPEEIKDMLS